MQDDDGGGDTVVHSDRAAETVQFLFRRFLEEYTSTGQQAEAEGTSTAAGLRESAATGKIYTQQVLQLSSADSTTLHVNMQHVDEYNETLATAIVTHYYRFEEPLRRAVQALVADLDPDYAKDGDEGKLKDFWVAFHGLSSTLRVRELTTEQIGKLVRISGTVTRTSEVRPELLYACFACSACGRRQSVEQQFKYTLPQRCLDPTCGSTGRAADWTLLLESSTFIDWQKVTLQEHSAEIPPGSMPRSLEIVLRGDAVEKARAGDTCFFTGCLIVIPDVAALRIPGVSVRAMREASKQSGFTAASSSSSSSGVRGLNELGVRDLCYRLSFLASSVQRMQSRFGNAAHDTDGTDGDGEAPPAFSDDELEEIERLRSDAHVYSRLAQSIAPSVFGHEEIKRGILLMLFGGLHKVTDEGINIRGDINVCIVGDPSMSKSQFLKYVTLLLPRSVYTSGKASSAAGLTATVARDPETGDFNIEAGALMLADNGVCCIDEFDKMDVKDQVAIHEAMEQQTISIAKAGIKATLNARTSILAAANPISGRYDKSKTLRGNLNIGAAVMSRFDLFFVVVDESDEDVDRRIANHILAVHQRQSAAVQPPVSPEQLSRYLRYARTIKPVLSPAASQLLVENYRGLRQADVSSGKTAYRITVRQLESMIRLSEALARVHCDPVVQPAYVREAARLLQKSIINVETEDVVFDSADLSVDGPLLNSRKHPRPTTTTDDDDDAAAVVEDDAAAAVDDDAAHDHSTPADSSQSSQSSRPARKAKKKLHMSFEEYERIASILMVALRTAERKTGDGLSQQQLINAYLRKTPPTDSRSALAHTTRCAGHVIQRLIEKDGLIVVSRQHADPLQRVLRAHADYDPDEEDHDEIAIVADE